MIPEVVCSVSNSCCVRNVKESEALMSIGVRMLFMCRKSPTHPIRHRNYEILHYNDRSDLREQVKKLTDVDVFHVHNEPDWMVSAIREALPESVIVYDTHDLDSMRNGTANDDEVAAVRDASAFVFPSQAYYDGVTEYHHIHNGKPKAVVYSMCNTHNIVRKPLPRLGGLVYEGGTLPDNAPDKVQYRNYTWFVSRVTEMGIPITLFGGNDSTANRDEYLAAGGLFLRRYPYAELLRNLSRYDWGVCVARNEQAMMDAAMPNKLFEYMAAGLPVIVINHKEVGEFVERWGVGVVVDDVEDIPKIYYRVDKYRRRVLEVREEFTMERQIPTLLNLYDGVLQGKRND